MARLTPLAKGLLTVVIVAGAASVAWHLGLADKIKDMTGSGTSSTSASAYSSSSGNDHQASTASANGDTGTGPLGSSGHPLKVSIVSFHGYAPALVANGNSLTTQPGSIYDKLGLNVNFIIQDDIPTLSTIFEAGTAQCAWRTSDFWAQEQPNLRNAKLDGRAVMIVDNTQGADAIIARDPNIRSVEDLAGKKIALLQYTPSHGMVIDAIDNSSMTARKKASVQYVFINADEGTAGVRSTLESGNVDAAALWDPDLSLAITNANAHVVYSTKTATNLIFDVMVCDSRVLATDEGRAAVQKFVQGWMQGVKAARNDPDNAVEALVKTEQYFELLAKNQGKPFIKGLFSSLVWTGLEDNARILGLAGGTNHYERVYQRFDGIYRAAGALANPKSPVIPPQESFDYSFIKNLLDQDQAAKTAAAAPQADVHAGGAAGRDAGRKGRYGDQAGYGEFRVGQFGTEQARREDHRRHDGAVHREQRLGLLRGHRQYRLDWQPRCQHGALASARARRRRLSGNPMGIPARAFQGGRQRPGSSAVQRVQSGRRHVARRLPRRQPHDARRGLLGEMIDE